VAGREREKKNEGEENKIPHHAESGRTPTRGRGDIPCSTGKKRAPGEGPMSTVHRLPEEGRGKRRNSPSVVVPFPLTTRSAWVEKEIAVLKGTFHEEDTKYGKPCGRKEKLRGHTRGEKRLATGWRWGSNEEGEGDSTGNYGGERGGPEG